MKQTFNPKARWDRHVPRSEETDDNNQDLNEKIDVLAWFENAKIYPREFSWKGKIYKIKKINYNWQERLGSETLNCFSVDTGSDLYQISFNNTTYSWKIDKIIQ